MKFVSTNGQSPTVDFRTAMLQGLAPDGGLYMPIDLPRLPSGWMQRARHASFQECAVEVAQLLLGSDLPEDVLADIVCDALSFDVPLIEIEDDVYVCELFHGPTCAFKDVAARCMARLFAYALRDQQEQLTILVATSGDTGGAVGHGFLDVPNARVVILYPSGKVSPLQEQQLTGMGGNVTALKVHGTFDDCQRIVKEAFADTALREDMLLAPANSINIARLLPQSFYHVFLAARMHQQDVPLVVSVPSGNFGNLTAGLLAQRMGAPIDQFIAATNVNDVMPHYLRTGIFEPRSSIHTLSNAMDIGNPSNAARMFALYDDVEAMRSDIVGVVCSDEETLAAIADVHTRCGYTMDPHTAIAYRALQQHRIDHAPIRGVFLATAHPGKFAETVEKATGEPVSLPERLQQYQSRETHAIAVDPHYEVVRDVLLQ